MINFLDDMLDFFLLIDNTYKPYLYQDTEKQLKQIKNKSYYVRKNHFWDILPKEQKQEIVFKYIDNVSIEIDKKIFSIKKININKNEIENIGYMFRENCFDILINSNDKNIILSNYQLNEDMENYIKSLSEFYKISRSNLNIKSLNLEELKQDNNLLQIIPNKKDNRFDKETLTLLSINA